MEFHIIIIYGYSTQENKEGILCQDEINSLI